jgi:hypothetical protein
MITQQRLKELFYYDTLTGEFTRRITVGRHGRHKVNDKVGTKQNYGYIVIGVDNRRYMAHRLAWLYIYGTWPDNDIDHINQNKSDNRIANLRVVSRSKNMHNVNLHKHNTSGYKGVSWHKPNKKWRAYIFLDYHQKHLGLFDKIEDAISARRRAELKAGM